MRQVGFKIHILPNGNGKQAKQSSTEALEASNPASCIINGLFIEGARWDPDTERLEEARPKIFQEPLPPILMEPVLVENAGPAYESPYIYQCPVYRTQLRAGEILPTGHSTNYIFSLALPSDRPPQHWISRGVAAILELCDI